jgi:hypothetical protein
MVDPKTCNYYFEMGEQIGNKGLSNLLQKFEIYGFGLGTIKAGQVGPSRSTKRAEDIGLTIIVPKTGPVVDLTMLVATGQHIPKGILTIVEGGKTKLKMTMEWLVFNHQELHPGGHTVCWINYSKILYVFDATAHQSAGAYATK